MIIRINEKSGLVGVPINNTLRLNTHFYHFVLLNEMKPLAFFVLILLVSRGRGAPCEKISSVRIMRGGDNHAVVSLKTENSNDETTDEDIIDEFRSQVQSIMLEAREDLKVQFENAYKEMHNAKVSHAEQRQRQAEIDTIVDSLALHDSRTIKLDIFNNMETDDGDHFVGDTDEEAESDLGHELSTESPLARELVIPNEKIVDSVAHNAQTIEIDEPADVAEMQMEEAHQEFDMTETTTASSKSSAYDMKSRSKKSSTVENQIHNQMQAVDANELDDKFRTNGADDREFDFSETTVADLNSLTTAMNYPAVLKNRISHRRKISHKKKAKIKKASNAIKPAVLSSTKMEHSNELEGEESIDPIAFRHRHITGEGRQTRPLLEKPVFRLLFWTFLFFVAKLFVDFVVEHFAKRV
jgi:hypothetical protein